MSVLGWGLLGLVIGLVARATVPERDPLGVAGTAVLGVLGAVFAGWVGESVGWYTQDDEIGFLCAASGSVALLFLYFVAAEDDQLQGGHFERKNLNHDRQDAA